MRSSSGHHPSRQWWNRYLCHHNDAGGLSLEVGGQPVGPAWIPVIFSRISVISSWISVSFSGRPGL